MPRKEKKEKVVPDSVTYEPPGQPDPWRVADWKGFRAVMPIDEEDLPDFHEIMSRLQHKGWHVMRLLFGIAPLIPKEGAELPIPRAPADVAILLNLSPNDVAAAPKILASRWKLHLREQPEGKKQASKLNALAQAQSPKEVQGPTSGGHSLAELMSPSAELPSKPVENMAGDDLLRRHGFGPETFKIGDSRFPYVELAERESFIGRIKDFERALEDPRGKQLARHVLMKELILRRMAERIAELGVDTVEFKKLSENMDALEKTYIRQLEQLETICPYIRSAANRANLIETLSGVIEGVRNYWSNPENFRPDGFLTAKESQNEMKQSEQFDVRYRPSLIADINDAMAHLFDPKYRRQYSNSQLATLDAGFKAGINALNAKRKAKGWKPIDLESDGPAGEYPPYHEPGDADTEVEVEDDEEDASVPLAD